jgi:hypothetical protein
MGGTCATAGMHAAMISATPETTAAPPAGKRLIRNQTGSNENDRCHGS